VEEDVAVRAGVESLDFGPSSIRFYFYLLNEGISRVRSHKIPSCIDWAALDGIRTASASLFPVLSRKGGTGRSSKPYLCVTSRVARLRVLY